MKSVVVLLGLSVMACGKKEFIQQQRVAITDPPPKIAGSTSNLSVPTTCPVWAPGGGDVDTPEPPFTAGVAIICGVDDAGGSYGIATGDAPTAHLNVLPGNHELGVYVGFTPDYDFSPDELVLVGANANVEAAAGPYNIDTPTNDGCCPEAHPDAQRPISLVAVGDHGLLFSLGTFDTSSVQVVFSIGGNGVAVPPSPVPNVAIPYAGGRFYVNGAP